MNPGTSWKRFESSGRIEDYLAYKSEESAARGEEWNAYDDDDGGAGAARDEDRRG